MARRFHLTQPTNLCDYHQLVCCCNHQSFHSRPLDVQSTSLWLIKPDRTTADDLLGFLEIPLKGVMSDPATKNRFSQREDGFQDSEGISYPGKLYWEVGYFEKTGLGEYLSVTEDPDFNETKKGIEEETESELRESNLVGKSSELKQQKKEDLKDRTNDIISASSPNLNWPSGILNIKIEQIVGLELDGTSKPGVKEEEDDEEAEDLPSAYCTVILNHQKIYKTRTKFKDSKPFVRTTPPYYFNQANFLTGVWIS